MVVMICTWRLKKLQQNQHQRNDIVTLVNYTIKGDKMQSTVTALYHDSLHIQITDERTKAENIQSNITLTFIKYKTIHRRCLRELLLGASARQHLKHW